MIVLFENHVVSTPCRPCVCQTLLQPTTIHLHFISTYFYINVVLMPTSQQQMFVFICLDCLFLSYKVQGRRCCISPQIAVWQFRTVTASGVWEMTYSVNEQAIYENECGARCYITTNGHLIHRRPDIVSCTSVYLMLNLCRTYVYIIVFIY